MKLTFNNLFAHYDLKGGIFHTIRSIVFDFENETVTFINEDGSEYYSMFFNYGYESTYHYFYAPDPLAKCVMEFLVYDNGEVCCFKDQDGVPDDIREKMKRSLFRGIHFDLIIT